ncbi:MAG: DNA recombination protein RmuC [Arenicellales bacterium]|nr:DNA recombination protein RmuC [Arenicellales bacterium]
MPELPSSLDLNHPIVFLLACVFAFGVFIGWLFTYLSKYKKVNDLTRALDLEKEMNRERHATMEKTFTALSANALQNNNRAFVELAQQVLGRFQVQAKGDLDLKQQAIKDLVKPIRDALNKTEQQLQQLERERRESHGALNKHLETLTQTQQALEGETRNLVKALRRPEVRGQWGELTLRRLAELAGMVEHCDFLLQVHTHTENGSLRPDMIVHMPGERQVVVDVKTPLDAYLSAIEAEDEAERQKRLKLHARHVRDRVRELAGKRYWDQFDKAPEFVILFIPGDQFLSAALDADPSMLEDALSQRVILTTPTSFVALLRAVAYGWRQETLSQNAEKIRDVGQTLYHRIGTLAEHLTRLGKHLEASVSQFNRLVGSFESKVLPGARKFTELGVSSTKEPPQPTQIDATTRESSSAEQ